MQLFLAILLSFCLAQQVNGLKILFYQVAFGHSHTRFSGRLIDLLVERGHTVDQVFPAWTPSLKFTGTNKQRHVYRIEAKDSPYVKSIHMNDPFGPKADYVPIFQQSQKLFCSKLLSQKDLLETLKNEKYDIGLSTAFDNCGLGLFHLIGINVTATYSATSVHAGAFEWQGISTPPSFITDLIAPTALGTRFNWYERALNLLKYLHNHYKISQIIDEESKIFHAFHPEMPTIHELIKRQTFMFINSHQLLDISRVYSSKAQFIGGIHLTDKQVEPLSDDYVKLIEQSEKENKQLVLVSLGSVVKMSNTPTPVRHAFFEAFGELQNCTFIWAHDNPELDGELATKYPNIHLKAWIPQKQLLNDKRVKLFLTHSGLNSYIETAYNGKPMIALPLIIDQHFNAGAMVQKGLGVMLDKFEVTKESVKQAVLEILNNEKYTKNAQKLAEMIKHQPYDPIKLFTDQVEYAARFPELAEMLELESSKQSFFVFHSLDSIAILIILTLLILVAFIWILKRVSAFLISNKKKVKVN